MELSSMQRIWTSKDMEKIRIAQKLLKTPTIATGAKKKIPSLETAKIFINSVLYIKNAKFMVIYLSNFYIQNNLEEYQFIRFHISMIPQEIIDKYNLKSIVEEDGWMVLC